MAYLIALLKGLDAKGGKIVLERDLLWAQVIGSILKTY